MNKNFILLGFLFLVTLFSVFGNEIATVDEEHLIWADIISGANFFSVNSVQINIYNPQKTLTYSDNMTFFSAGQYTYNFTPDITGAWYAVVTYYNTTSKIATSTSTITVIQNQGDIMINESILLVLIGIALVFLAYYITNWAIMVGAGIWFLIIAFYVDVIQTPVGQFSETLFFLLIGLLLIYQGIAYLMNEKKKRDE